MDDFANWTVTTTTVTLQAAPLPRHGQTPEAAQVVPRQIRDTHKGRPATAQTDTAHAPRC